jgi:hypothetical protein
LRCAVKSLPLEFFLTAHPEPEHTKIVACATVVEEMLPYLPAGMACEVLDFGLHLEPDGLKQTLQGAIDATRPPVSAIVLGYGLCAMAVVGLRAAHSTLIIPRLDDCIGIFLGSKEAYRQQAHRAPGTYYLTKGWIEVNDTPLEEYKRLAERYGAQRADRMMRLMLKNYTRIAYIDTGREGQEKYRAYARRVAAQFDLQYEEIPGSNELVRKMIFGPWDEDTFVVKRPGERVVYADFQTVATTTNNLAVFQRSDALANPDE